MVGCCQTRRPSNVTTRIARASSINVNEIPLSAGVDVRAVRQVWRKETARRFNSAETKDPDLHLSEIALRVRCRARSILSPIFSPFLRLFLSLSIYIYLARSLSIIILSINSLCLMKTLFYRICCKAIRCRKDYVDYK